MRFSEGFLEDVKDKNDIVDVISSYTTLKKSGTSYVGLCPFHSEKTPSFHVSSDKQLYYCFGCGAGGTIINFIEAAENLDFLETVRFLAERAGIAVPEENMEDTAETRLKNRIFEMNKIAGKTYFKMLNSSAGSVALSYLRNRGLKDETITKYGLGYSLDSWDFMYRTLKSKGYGDDEIVKSGLCVNKNGKIFDFFRNRVMFPVMDVRGNVIAFGGRDLGDGMPKYLNTGDTPVFKKRYNLFNLNIAKNIKTDFIILAEGYMDVIALYQGGFGNAVASLGTSFAPEHSRLLKRYTQKVVISYDSDAAGRNAAVKAAAILKKDGIKVKVLKISGAKDPDELIKKFGPEAYQEAINSALSGIEFDLMGIYPEGGFTDDDERVEYVKKAADILKYTQGRLELEVYAKKTAELAGVSYETVMAYVENKKKKEKKYKEINFEKSVIIRKRSAEDTLIKIIAENSSYFSKIKDKISIDDFESELNKKIYDIICDFNSKGIKFDVSQIFNRLSSDEAKEAGKLFIEKEPVGDFDSFFESLIDKVREEREKKQRDERILDGDDADLLEYANKIKEKQQKKTVK